MKQNTTPDRTPVAPPEEDPNVEPREYASPPCLMHELDPAWQGPLSAPEVTTLLNELLARTRAAARRMTVHARDVAHDARLHTLLQDMARAERRCVRELCGALRRLDQPADACGDTLRRDAEPGEPAGVMLDGTLQANAAIARRLCSTLPRIDDDALQRVLVDMLVLHEQSVERCRALLAVRGGSPAGA